MRLTHGRAFRVVKLSGPDWTRDAKQGAAVIVLHGTEPAFGVPQASPFAMKVEVLLKLSGLAYTVVPADIRAAPRGKIPWIVDDGAVISDSRMIQTYLEQRYGVDFSGGYSARALGHGLAIARMLEDHLYPLIMAQRWDWGAAEALAPQLGLGQAPLFGGMWLRLQAARRARGLRRLQGLDRLTAAEQLALVSRAVEALEAAIAGQIYLLGGRVCGVDATAYGFLAALAAPQIGGDAAGVLRRCPELLAYLARMQAEFYPDFVA